MDHNVHYDRYKKNVQKVISNKVKKGMRINIRSSPEQFRLQRRPSELEKMNVRLPQFPLKYV